MSDYDAMRYARELRLLRESTVDRSMLTAALERIQLLELENQLLQDIINGLKLTAAEDLSVALGLGKAA